MGDAFVPSAFCLLLSRFLLKKILFLSFFLFLIGGAVYFLHSIGVYSGVKNGRRQCHWRWGEVLDLL